ncbi:MAG: HU family DNA-binding protein [Bdellovibrionaceae bacterium]|nr:HU family DNA-binding protein [Pseudobdellovibrionaceae bacterium]
MNKNELVDKVATLTKLTKADCQRVIDAVIDTTRVKIKRGEEVRLVGFGTFVRSKRSARKGRNPQTGEEIQIKSQWVPKFRPGKEFKEYLR